MATHDPTDRVARNGPAAPVVIAATALAYGLIGWLALMLAGPPGYASPLYPSAGIALAATLVYGRAALPGVFIAAFGLNAALGALRDHTGPATLALPLWIGLGATVQAAAGTVLVRRFVGQPMVLNAPREIFAFGVASLVGCLVSASVATPALWASAVVAPEASLSNWITWWVGDSLGVLIGAPLALTLIGRPRADWRRRQRTLALPLLLALGLVAAGMVEFRRLDDQRVAATFERDADRLASEARSRLVAPLYALQALHSSARTLGFVDREWLPQAARWWLAQPIPLQAMGYSERVTADAVPAFEAAARAQGLGGYHVFDRDGGVARAADREVVALRLIQPSAGNSGALGVNVMSVPAARAAVLASRNSGEPAATAGFKLTQSPGDETGVVIYQALYQGEPADEAARRTQFRGVVFVTVRTDLAMAALATPAQQYLRWCLVDAEPNVERRRLAGPPGCERAGAGAAAGLQAQRSLLLGGRPVELRVSVPEGGVPGPQREAAWLMSMTGLAAATMLGALLLTVTGHSRRTELAVEAGTAQLRQEMGERALAEAALRESESRLRSILNHVPLGIMFLDPQGFLLDSNPKLSEMLGSSPKALRGRVVAEFVHPDESDRIRGLRRELLHGAASKVIDRLRVRGPQRTELVVRLSASALRDDDGRVLRMVAVLEDITEYLRLEESERALHRAEAANRAKSEFLSRMSHELRTPLNAMIGFAQLLGLDREPGLPAHQREWAQQIQRAGWHLLEMINETLDLARIESGAVRLTLSPVALAPLVSVCQAMVAAPAAQRGVRIAESIDPDAVAVVADATRLQQVLTNLLSNAVKYNRDGGAVTVTARRLPGGDRVEIAVADTGLGMSPAQLAALFQPYNRLGRESSAIEGTGIGLVISRRLTELMGGTLDASSEAGRGSIFTLVLPAADSAELPAARYTDTSPAPYRQRLVHYVEDNETNIEVMRGIFAQRAQITLETSTLGLDGLASIRQRRPDLILLDMQLPDISGMELLRHLKQDDDITDIPVIVVSADATAAHMQQALTSGALHYVTKPLDVARFLQTVDKVLENVETRWGT